MLIKSDRYFLTSGMFAWHTCSFITLSGSQKHCQVRNYGPREEKDKSRQEALYPAVQSDVVRPFSGEIYWNVQSIGLWTPFGCASMYLTRVIKSDLLSGSAATSSDRIAQSNWFVDIYWDCPETPMIYLREAESFDGILKRKFRWNFSCTSLAVHGPLQLLKLSLTHLFEIRSKPPMLWLAGRVCENNGSHS